MKMQKDAAGTKARDKHLIRLVCKNIWVRPYLGGNEPTDKITVLEKSRLESYRATCLLEQLDGREWRVTVVLHKKNGPIKARISDAKAFFARNCEDAKKASLDFVIAYVFRCRTTFAIQPSYKIGIFGGHRWENGATFRFR